MTIMPRPRHEFAKLVYAGHDVVAVRFCELFSGDERYGPVEQWGEGAWTSRDLFDEELLWW